LFDKVLFHPSFKLEDVSVRFATQIDRYEQTIFKTIFKHHVKGDVGLYEETKGEDS